MTLGETEALPSVTVIVPMYNEEAHIAACIDGLWKQTYRGEMEVLVVDGGSTHRSPEFVGELLAAIPAFASWPTRGGGPPRPPTSGWPRCG